MKRYSWQLSFGAALLIAAAAIYFLDYAVFGDARRVLTVITNGIAFVPIEVLLVTLIISQLLNSHARQDRMQKMNMVIGAFFSEAGEQLLKISGPFILNYPEVSSHLQVNTHWTPQDFESAKKEMAQFDYAADAQGGNLEWLKRLLVEKRQFMLRMLENPNLLEHHEFTDTLWAVFHLTEELNRRVDVSKLPQSDYSHLSNDIRRAYGALVGEWLSYLKHLKADYPYLYSLAARDNPFNPTPQVEVVE
jgi:hypothetical protein